MYFRGQKKLQGEVSLNEALDTGPEGDASVSYTHLTLPTTREV